MNRALKILYVTTGFLSLLAGIIGLFLPVIPTTPFVLLAAGCFLKGSKRLYAWITAHRIFGPPIDRWCRYHAVSRRTKVVGLSTLWFFMLISIIFIVPGLYLKLILVGITLAVTIHILALKTVTKEMMEEIDGSDKSA